MKSFCATCARLGKDCHGAPDRAPWTACALKQEKPTKPAPSHIMKEEPSAYMDSDPSRLKIKAGPAKGTMSQEEIAEAVKSWREYTRIKEEAEAELKAIQARIIAHMEAQAVEEISGTDYKASYKTVNGTKLDRAQLEADQPGLLARYTVPNPSHRFLLR